MVENSNVRFFLPMVTPLRVEMKKGRKGTYEKNKPKKYKCRRDRVKEEEREGADDEYSLRCVKEIFRIPSFFTERTRDSLLQFFYASVRNASL